MSSNSPNAKDRFSKNVTMKYDTDSPSHCGSIPLLVKLPDGERRQVDFPPNSSVRDLKEHIANLTAGPISESALPNSDGVLWDLDFAGSVMNENHTLGHYHIPDAYDHANGLLKTISDSGYDHPDKKVEAVDKALTLVRGISRGERDMERLIMSVYEDDVDEDNFVDTPPNQPSLSSIRRTCRSRIPSINLGQLTPLGSTTSTDASIKTALPSAPPTPSQLIRRLSNFRPDLYDPKAVEKVSGILNPAAFPKSNPRDLHDGSKPGFGSGTTINCNNMNEPGKLAYKQAQSEGLQEARGGDIQTLGSQGDLKAFPDIASMKPLSTSQLENEDIPKFQYSTEPSLIATVKDDPKREITWFADIMSSIGHSVSKDSEIGSERDGQHNDNLVDGDSEGDDDGYHSERDPGSAMADDRKEIGRPEDSSIQYSKNVLPTSSKGIRSLVVGKNNGSKTITSIEKCKVAPAVESESQPSNRYLAQTTNGKIDNNTNTNEERRRLTCIQIPGEECGYVDNRGHVAKINVSSPIQTQIQVIGLEPEVSMTTPCEHLKLPKKRGRKRKNPHLSEDERKAQRQAQNRESAKLSRIRRKNMTIEYERRVYTLEGENENLRDTVAALTGRLEMLQNLLTISVQKRAAPVGSPIAPIATQANQKPPVLKTPLEQKEQKPRRSTSTAALAVSSGATVIQHVTSFGDKELPQLQNAPGMLAAATDEGRAGDLQVIQAEVVLTPGPGSGVALND